MVWLEILTITLAKMHSATTSRVEENPVTFAVAST